MDKPHRCKKSSHHNLKDQSCQPMENNMADIEMLPDEVIIHIFSFMPFTDRKSSRLVNKRWQRISYSLCLINKDRTIIHNYAELGQYITPISRHVNVKCDLTKGILRGIVCDDSRATKFWRRTGQFLKSLNIICPCSCLGILSNIFASCPNLEHLSLTLVDSNDYSYFRSIRPLRTAANFPNMSVVSIRGDTFIIAPLLTTIVGNSSNLKKISLFCDCEHPKCVVEMLLAAVHKHVSLKKRDLNNEEVCNTFVTRWARFLDCRLNRLTVVGCDISDQSLPVIAEKATELQQLFLGICCFNYERFEHAFVNLNNLTVVSLKGSSEVTDDHVFALAALHDLTRLDLTRCSSVTNKGLFHVFGHSVRPQMIELRLASLDSITDELIISIAPNLPNLETLNLRGCILITKLALDAVFTNNIHMRCLSIRDCFNVESLMDGPSINFLLELRHLDILGAGCVTVQFLKLLELPQLESIDMCLFIYKRVVAEVASKCPSLKFLGCWGYKDGLVARVQEKTRLYLKCRGSPFGPC